VDGCEVTSEAGVEGWGSGEGKRQAGIAPNHRGRARLSLVHQFEHFRRQLQQLLLVHGPDSRVDRAQPRVGVLDDAEGL
jgi:hypothetical protein